MQINIIDQVVSKIKEFAAIAGKYNVIYYMKMKRISLGISQDAVMRF